MDGDDNSSEGEFGGMFDDGQDVPAEKPDIQFTVDRLHWQREGHTADGFQPLWTQSQSEEEREREVHGAGDSLVPTLTGNRDLTLFARDKHHSLWGHKIWNAAMYLSKLMDRGTIPIRGLSVLELGSGLGVPSLVAHQLGARVTVVTDYPDDDLIGILKKNVEANKVPENSGGGPLFVEPLLWGKKEHIQTCLDLNGSGSGFDVVILSDIVFNHVCHNELIKTVAICLAKDRRAAAYCAFSHHRTHKQQDDMDFFRKLEAFGLTWSKVDEEIYPLMFPDDPGDPAIRAPVHCFKIQHRFDDAGPPVDYHVDYDVVIEGTGITETFVSAALSRHGLKVLHLDQADAYGGAFNTLDPFSLGEFFKNRHEVCRDAVVQRNYLSATTTSTQQEEISAPESSVIPDDLAQNVYLRRRFLLDMLPLAFLSRGDLISALVDSESARNIEFQNVDGLVLASFSAAANSATPAALKLCRVPLTRSDVFGCKDFSPLEMRRLMKLLKDVEARLAEQEHAVVNSNSGSEAATPFVAESADETFPQFLRRKYQLSLRTVNMLTMFGLLQANPLAKKSSSTSDGDAIQESVNLLRTFLTSVGRFGGSTPFLVPNYGSAELPQNMCRVSAVWDGTFVLRRKIVSTWRDDRKAYARLSNGQVVETKAVVCAHSAVAVSASEDNGEQEQRQETQIARVIMVLKHPIIAWSDLGDAAPVDEEEAAIREHTTPVVVMVGGVSLKASTKGQPCSLEDDDITPVTVVQQGESTHQVPAGGKYVVLHISANAQLVSLSELGHYADQLLLSKSVASEDVWLRSSFIVNDQSPKILVGANNDEAPKNKTSCSEHDLTKHVFTVPTLLHGIDDGAYVRTARSVFEAVVRYCRNCLIDPWANCPFPRGKTSASSEQQSTQSPPAEAPIVFLPPPPEEITMQMECAGQADDDAQLLVAAVKQLETVSQ